MNVHPSRESRGTRTTYWAATALVATAFAVPGVANILRARHIAEDMARLGYPAYFMTLLGTWKVLGAVAVLAPRFPRLKEWAYAGMIFDLTGAAVSRAAVGDAPTLIAIPLLIALVVFVSWASRPDDRRLRPD